MRSTFVIGTLAVSCLALSLVTGCAKKELLKEEGQIKDQPAVVKQEPSTDKSAEREAARRERDRQEAEAKAEAARRAAANKEPAVGTVKEAKKDKAAEEIALDRIHFDFDKFTLRPEAREILKRHAELLTKRKTTQITIEGHCDERGTAEYNLALGERRADAAKKYLIQLGVDEKQINTISYGFEKPLDPGHDEDAWAKNRRDSFVPVR